MLFVCLAFERNALSFTVECTVLYVCSSMVADRSIDGPFSFTRFFDLAVAARGVLVSHCDCHLGKFSLGFQQLFSIRFGAKG